MKNRINFRIDPKIKKRLEKVAMKNGLYLSQIIRRGIVEQLKELEE